MKTLLCSSLLLAAAPLLAGELEQQMLRCSVLGEASARLGCYDALAKAATPSADAALAKPGPSAAVARGVVHFRHHPTLGTGRRRAPRPLHLPAAPR